MNRVIMSVVGVLAVLGATGSAMAQSDVDGTAYFVFTNWDNGDYNSQGPNFTSPTATTDGALWIKTGSGAPVWLSQDVNMQLNWRPTPTSAWTTITTLSLQAPAPGAADVRQRLGRRYGRWYSGRRIPGLLVR